MSPPGRATAPDKVRGSGQMIHGERIESHSSRVVANATTFAAHVSDGADVTAASRSERREIERRVRADLTRRGCQCHPRLTPDPNGRAGWVHHAPGCPLSNAIAELRVPRPTAER